MPAAPGACAQHVGGGVLFGLTRLAVVRSDRPGLPTTTAAAAAPCLSPPRRNRPPRAPAFDPGSPELFYLPSFFHEPQLSDISATLGGMQLPLHTQVLAVRVGACLAAVTSGLELEGADARPAKVCGGWVGG